MYVRIVTFRLDGISPEDYEAQAESLAPAFNDWPGLMSKTWLADPASATYGGVYLFESQADADGSRQTEEFAGLLAAPYFSDLEIRELGVLEAPTAITGPLKEAIR